jgi:DNA-binding GntR family transcriptional regulator
LGKAPDIVVEVVKKPLLIRYSAVREALEITGKRSDMKHRKLEEIRRNGASDSKNPMENDEIYEKIFEVIVDHKLLPGTHLKEEVLCDVYNVGRTRIRAVLARLASDHVIELVANRGAFVCNPSAEEAREVFRARRLIEGHLVRLAAESRDEKLRRALEQHIREEQEAHDSGAQGVVIKRCGNFHQVLADQAGSPILARFLHELIARSALIVAIYEERPGGDCELEEHRKLAELVTQGRADEAVKLMETHLTGIESRLDLDPVKKADDELRKALSLNLG